MARDPALIQELAADAKNILASKGFAIILEKMMAKYVQELLTIPVGDLRAQSLHASMKAVEDFRNEAQSLINDEKMGTKR